MGVSKKIVVITGSPRKNGNSLALAEAFIKAAEKKGHQVTRYDAAEMTIDGCTACGSCYTTGQACTFDDDFNQMAPAIEEADAVVLATPLYWYTFPAKLKAAIDKFYALVVGKRGLGGKECALMVCCEEEAVSALDGIRFAYQHTIDLLEWKSVGEVLVTSANAVGDVYKTDGPARAEALADKF